MIECPHWSPCGVADGGCCALGRHGGKPHRATCLRCLSYGATTPAVQVTTPPPPTPTCWKPVPREKWPLPVQALAKLQEEGDRGVGDTVHRNLTELGADALVRLYRIVTGHDCKCSERRERLNLMFPY